ncbi:MULTISPECIES: heavy metal translocating P-type ATPase metal-binding domain-containing protein [unclassified Lentimicrobium]|uniref:heavy metal translocating P-type ATPase n=1 Tax=unclassified Lentimicrobium TaxID=2677434 RepID=UPI001551883C|nr:MULTISPECIES: heavy metal translocating P-type ATPase metal-binding domain-containing protein [unclassified Lentimicrobium]NPD47633.1 HAD-IC family P-type ATPase [Lentimicrobium sp. S6]NPD86509.1 HAD-IC family P-type ATPase [Lentimicrobium sp. L6]
MAKENQKCIHCGEDCGKYPIMWEEKPFCCNGCKTVYQLLNENKLYTYYEMEKNPGVRVDEPEFGTKFAYLDDETIKEKLLEFKDGDYSKITFYIPAIHCSSCIWLLEHLNTLNSGITYSMVNFVKKEVSVTFKEELISLRQIVELLASIHYTPMITLDNMDKKSAKKEDRKLLFKLGVAGFAFGNIMLLSFPDYLAGEQGVEPALQRFFNFLNLLFALPVLIYSARDYLLSAYKNLVHGVINTDLPISIGIIALFSQSTYEILSNSGTGYMDSFAGFIFFLLIGKWYQNKTYQALAFDRDYKSYFPIAITKIVDEKEEVTQIKDLVEGDRILVRHHELIPVDATLVKGVANIDYSFVTGETNAVNKLVGEPVYAGGKQLGAALELTVNKSVDQSSLTKLWNQSEGGIIPKQTLNNMVDRISKWFTIIVISLALITMIVWFFIDAPRAVSIFTAVLIVACPCALALSIPFTYGNSLRIYGKRGFYLKNSQVIENLSKIDTIVFDKTGTITQSNALDINFNGVEPTREQLSFIKSIARQSTHPLSVALYQHLSNLDSHYVDSYKEIAGKGVEGFINQQKVKIGSAVYIGAVVKPADEFMSRVYISINDQYLGYFSLENKYRDGLTEIISQLKKKYEVHLISGDNEGERKRLMHWFKDNKYLHFNQKPADKLDYIRALQAEGKNVLMIGDGLNDAGALNQSNVGITIADDIYNFSPACDGIMESGKFKSLYRYIRFSKSSIRVVKISFLISLLYNSIGLTFAIDGLLTPIVAAILMPVSSVTVVVFVTLATNISAMISDQKKLA